MTKTTEIKKMTKIGRSPQSYFCSFLLFLSFILLFTFFFAPRASLAATLSKAPNNLGLTAAWNLNEGVGSVAGDSSGRGNTGTIIGTPTWTSGKHGNALNFDGSSNYISTSYTLPNVFSISMWFNSSEMLSATYNRGLFSTYASGVWNGIYIGMGSPTWSSCTAQNNKLAVFLDGNACQMVSYTFSTGTWYHITVTSSGSSVKVYVNGVLTDTYASATTHAAPLFIGRTRFNTDYFKGKLDDVRVYSRVLSAADAQSLYQAGQVTRKMVSNQGLAGYWSLNEGVGNQAGDTSGNRNNGTLSGATLPTWTAGKRGNALNFDGTSSRVNLGNVTVSASTTVSAWIKTSTAAQRPVFSNRGSGLYFGVTGGKFFIYYNPATPSPSMSSIASVNNNVWRHVVWTSDGSTSKMYIDGSLDSTQSQSRSAQSGTAYIGFDNSNSEYFPGLIDDVRVYNRTLTSAEVLALYKQNETNINHSQNSRLTNGLVGMWSFNGSDIDSTYAYDRSGNARNSTLTGSPKKVIGKVGQALNFSGTGQYAQASGFSEIGTANQAYSLAAWVKPATGETDGNIIHMSSASNGLGWCLPPLTLVAGKATGNSWNGGGVSVTGTSTISPGNWYYLVNTWDSTGGLKIYVNGVLENTTAQATYTASGVSNYIWLSYTAGTCSGDNGDFDGAIDEVRVYSRSLSASEVKLLYNMGR